MLKKQQNNKGYTLVELIVSIAILAFIGIAIGGLMSSNTVIFRKSKAELEVQNVAQDTYNRLSNDLMQAKSIYIEGYKTDTKVNFGDNIVGGNVGVTATSGIFVSDTDLNLINDLGSYSGTVPDGNTLETAANGTFATKDEKDKFNTYYYKLRYMSDDERSLYSNFISSIPAGTYTSFGSLKTSTSDGTGSTPKYTYDDIYVTKLVIMYLTPYDEKYKGASVTVPADTVYDNCTVTYEFVKDGKSQVHITTDYDYMTSIESDDTFTDMLNYRMTGSTIIPGMVANVDSSNNAIGIKMYFAKSINNDPDGRKYNSEGIITFRNSNVVKNAK
jgi:prepilin-type N-terminal cleavage/methylation domain-containing protein